GMTYKAGDSLGVFASNRPEDVAEILKHLGCSGDEEVTLPKAAAPITLRHALTSVLTIAGPTKRFIEALAAKAGNADEKAKLQGLLAPESKEVLTAFLKDREFVDLLAEFPSARLAPAELIEHLRKLSPRLYSIASSGRVHPTDVHLTVAIVRYQTNSRARV